MQIYLYPAAHLDLPPPFDATLFASIVQGADCTCPSGPPRLHDAWKLPGISLHAATATSPLLQLHHLPPPPWQPLLEPHVLQRGLAYYGSGARIERVAGKLLDGQRIKAFTIGGSVTSGAGASDVSRNYASRFFHFINTTFPHR